MSSPATTIRRVEKATRADGFERLLNAGLQKVRDLSGALWTDHNLHDPGITVLEQLCFALTELAYHADFPVEDHLAGPDGRIPFEALALHPPREALSCRATTADDYRRLLLDRVDGLDDAHLLPAPAAPRGVFRLLLRPSAGAAALPDALQREALRAYRAERNLGEDVEPPPRIVRDKACHLVGTIELTGPRDGAEVLAEIYHRVGRWIDRSPRRLSRAEVLSRKGTLDRVYDGPRTENGFLDEHEDVLGQSLYAADLARVIREVQGVQEVQALSLLADRRQSSSALLWRQGDWALRLHVPGAPDEDDRVGVCVMLRRRQHELQVSPEELWRRVQNLQAVDRAQRRRLRRDLREEELAELPRGTGRAESGRHHSVQHHFPPLYGLGEHGLPDSASPQRKAAVRQLQSYLMLFEQILANGEAQVRHLRDLFSAADDPKTYWWPALTAEDVPGLDRMLTLPHEEIARQLGAFFDRSSMRKSRLLDHLLALHGETITQNALRQFCGHLRSDELDRRLLVNKARYLRQIVELGRDRAGAFDYAKALWGNPRNYSGLARRVCLLLGFRHEHARPLTWALRQAGVKLVEVDDDAQGSMEAEQALLGEATSVLEGDAVEEPTSESTQGALQESLRRLLGAVPRLYTPLVRAAAGHDSYRIVELDPPGADPRPWKLVVGPDAHRRWWRLGAGASRPVVEQAARQLRRTFLDLNDECEGLHLVEHVLLRPLRADSPAHLERRRPEDFYTLRLTAVLPGWTVRTHQTAFRRLAEETLRLNTPAHLEVATHWLTFDEMAAFEDDYEIWLQRRQAWCEAGPQGDVASLERAVDDAAARLIGHLLSTEPAS